MQKVHQRLKVKHVTCLIYTNFMLHINKFVGPIKSIGSFNY
jgi:hypothetical protein